MKDNNRAQDSTDPKLQYNAGQWCKIPAFHCIDSMTKLPLLSVPLGTSAHQSAKSLAQQAMQVADDSQRFAIGRRVYLQSLAVQAVGSYLQWQGYELDWAASESQNPLLCGRWEVADIKVVGVGRLDCQTIAPGELLIPLPQADGEVSLGTVVVQLGEELTQAQLVGFASVANPLKPQTGMAVADLRSLDDLIQYLHRLEQGLNLLQGTDGMAQQVQQVWGDRDLVTIVAQLERIYRQATPEKWRYAAFEVLSQGNSGNPAQINPFGYGSSGGYGGSYGSYGGSFRETGSSLHLQDLAEQLLHRLAEAWQ